MKEILFILLSLNTMNFAFSQTAEKFEDMLILILDVQNRDTQNEKFKETATNMVESINFVIKNVDTSNVIYIKTSHKLLNLSLSRPFIYTTVDTSKFSYIDKRINIVNKNIFNKKQNNAFESQKIRCFLDKHNAKKIVIVGLLAEQCIFETLMEGKKLGYEMYVIPEAIIGKSEKSKSKMIQYFKKEGINILQLK